MEKNQFSPPEVQEITYIFNIEPIEDVERKSFQFEDLFQKTFNSKVVLTKVPEDAPLNIPRFLLQAGSYTLETSLIDIKFISRFPDRNNAKKSIQQFSGKINGIFEKLLTLEYLNIESIEEVVIIKHPLKNMDLSLVRELYGQYFKQVPPEHLENFSFDYKTHAQNNTSTVRIETYTKQTIKIHHNSNGKPKARYYKLSDEAITITERGVATIRKSKVKNDSNNIKGTFNVLVENLVEAIKLSKTLIFH